MYTDLHVTKVKVWSGSEWRNIFQGSKSTSCPLNYIEHHICEMGYIENKKKNSRAREANGSNDRPGETLKVPRAQVNIKHSVFTWRHDSHLVTKRRLCMLVSMSEINPVGVDPPINLHSCCAACGDNKNPCVIFLTWQFEPSLQRNDAVLHFTRAKIRSGRQGTELHLFLRWSRGQVCYRWNCTFCM